MFGMSVVQWMVLLTFFLKDALTLKDVLLTIDPRIVERHKESTLRCTYNLEGAQLYSVKWYRGKYEFYRNTPSEQPPSKVFPLAKITVDLLRSNTTQVVLLDIEFNLSGNFTCEVTTADMPVSTGTSTQSMLVVQLPDEPPVISVGRAPLDYGDILRANCSSHPSRPPASVKFMLNNLTVAWTDPIPPKKSQEYLWTDLSLELQLNEVHFSNGRLVLRCVADVTEIYREEAVLELESARHPVPQKVSAVDATAGRPVALNILVMVLVSAILVVIRS